MQYIAMQYNNMQYIDMLCIDTSNVISQNGPLWIQCN